MPYHKHEYGLVFSGGGARGAYEMGVYNALDKLNITPFISGVSGSSVGALNALLFTSVSAAEAQNQWLKITQEDFLYLPKTSSKKYIKEYEIKSLLADESVPTDSLVKKILLHIAVYHPEASALINIIIRLYNKLTSKKIDSSIDFSSIAQFVKYSLTIDGFFSQQKIEDVISEMLLLRSKKTSIPFFVTVTRNITNKSIFCNPTPMYINLEGMSDNSLKDYVLASSALPIIYPAKKIGNHYYYDGGFTDNTPIKPLYDIGLRKFIVVYLDNECSKDIRKLISQENILFPDAEIVRIIPDCSFKDNILSILVISKNITTQRMTQGFNDAMKVLSGLA